jgi:Domain of unknown function (DUF4226)
MVDQAGPSATAIGAVESALSQRHAAAATADRALADAVAVAHTLTVEGLRRLDAIEADIESAVAQQDTLALDTPAEAHRFQRFLLAKHREILDVVSATAAAGEAKKVELQGLLTQYPTSPGSSTP